MTEAQSPEISTELSFEDALRQLEEIVRKLESGDAPLDDAITLYSKGEELRLYCQQRLDSAQARIEKLRIDGSGAVTGSAPLEPQG